MKTSEKEKTNDHPHGSAYQQALYQQEESQSPPEFAITAEGEQTGSRSPCNRVIDPPENVEEADRAIDEIVLRDKLVESYTRQTITELITLKSDDNKGSNDPYTQFVHAFYSPADEFDNALKTIDNLPDLMNSMDEAFKTGAPDKIESAAEKLYDASKDLPGTPLTGVPKSKKDVFKIKKILEAVHSMYKVYVKETAFEDVCDPTEQVKSGIGKVIRYSWVLNYVEFVSTQGHTMTGAYSDLPEDKWWLDEDNDQWFIEAAFLPHYEAIIKSKE